MIQMTDIEDILKRVSVNCTSEVNPCEGGEAETRLTCDPRPKKYLPVERGGKAGGVNEDKVWRND